MNWIPRSDSLPPDEAHLEDWAKQLEISPLLVKLLWNRGLYSVDDMHQYLSPSLQGLAPLDAWPGLQDAATLLAQSLVAGNTLAVWGDYDVDGITSTTLVKDFIGSFGFPCLHHIPDRISEGYGLNKDGISKLAEQGVTLLLTVDSGISDVDAIAHAKKLGMTVIISDHHLPAQVLPPADVIVNPRLAPCPCPALAGVGVAFFLMAATNVALHSLGYEKKDIRPLLDLVALGTLADVVNLGGQNRILVKNGLLQIASGKRPGVAALKNACNFSPTATLGAGQVVYSLAPRINAAGRLGSSEVALALLATKEHTKAHELAAHLGNLNQQRRSEEDKMLSLAKEQAQIQMDSGTAGIVLYNEHWHQGIIGIVASRILEIYHRPVVVITDANGHLKGSGRSIRQFDIHEAFSQCADLLLGYGGHKMAAGLSLSYGMLAMFRQRFNELAVACFGLEEPEATCKIDAELSLALAADFTFLKELELLQPFGNGNPEPAFSSPPVRVKRILQRPGFCQLDLEEETSGITLRAKAWRELAHSITPDIKGTCIRIAYSPRIDRYNGAATVELRMKDWKKEESAAS